MLFPHSYGESAEMNAVPDNSCTLLPNPGRQVISSDPDITVWRRRPFLSWGFVSVPLKYVFLRTFQSCQTAKSVHRDGNNVPYHPQDSKNEPHHYEGT